MAILTIDNLKIAFDTDEGSIAAVDGASFALRENTTLGLVGESGSGKSVISQAIMGLLPPKAKIVGGRILFNDPQRHGKMENIAELDPAGARMRALRGNRIAMIFQEPMTSLSPLHTIGAQIAEAAMLHRDVTWDEARALTREILELVRFPDAERGLDTYPFELSGGLRQRAMIAMAMICHPAVLIADEPTTALDVTIQAEILKLIRDLQPTIGMAVLLITHDFGVVANMADDVAVIYRGRIVERGTAHALFETPRHPYLKALLNAVPYFDMPAGRRLAPIRPIELSEDIRIAAPKRSACALGAPILKVTDVTKRFYTRKGGLFGKIEPLIALDRVNLTVARGESVGIVGESGSGKTTLARTILRAIAIDDGEISYDAGDGLIDISALQGQALLDFRRRMQLIFQDPFSSLNPRMTVNDVLCEPFEIHGLLTPSERAERVRELMELVGLDGRFLRRYPHSFSGGQRQRIGIARALALGPEFLILDEPTSALDVSVQAQILNLLSDLRTRLSLTYLFVSHNLAVVDYIADRVAVMCRGRIVEVGPTRTIVDAPHHPYTKALLSAVPNADIARPLDFAIISRDRVSEPELWPKPFRIQGDAEPRLFEIGPSHFVAMPDGPAPAYH